MKQARAPVVVVVVAVAAVAVVVVVAAYISRCWLDLWVMTKTKFCTFRAADKITETNEIIDTIEKNRQHKPIYKPKNTFFLLGSCLIFFSLNAFV